MKCKRCKMWAVSLVRAAPYVSTLRRPNNFRVIRRKYIPTNNFRGWCIVFAPTPFTSRSIIIKSRNGSAFQSAQTFSCMVFRLGSVG